MEDCESQHLAAKKGVVQKLPEARCRNQTQQSVRHTRSPGGAEQAISKVPVEGVHANFRGCIYEELYDALVSVNECMCL